MAKLIFRLMTSDTEAGNVLDLSSNNFFHYTPSTANELHLSCYLKAGIHSPGPRALYPVTLFDDLWGDNHFQMNQTQRKCQKSASQSIRSNPLTHSSQYSLSICKQTFIPFPATIFHYYPPCLSVVHLPIIIK